MPELQKVGAASDPLNSIFGIHWPYGAQVMALRSLAGELSLCVREDGTWYVSLPHVSLRKDGLLSTPTQKGVTPHEAIAAAWNQYGAADAVVVVDHPNRPRRVLRWNTFMWIDINPKAGLGAEGEQP